MLLLAAIAGLFVLPTPWNVLVVVVAAFIEIGELWAWRRFLSRYRVRGGAEGMVGERAEVIERCAPRGRAMVRGEIWDAVAAEPPLDAGERAVVTAIEGLTVELARR